MANEAINGHFGQRCGLSDMLIVGVSLQKRNETRVPLAVPEDGRRSLPCSVFRRPVECALAAATSSLA